MGETDIGKIYGELEQKRQLAYNRVLEELGRAGFNRDDVLDGAYGNEELFVKSPTLVSMAVESLRYDLDIDVKRKPEDYIDSRGDLVVSLNVNDYVENILNSIRKSPEKE